MTVILSANFSLWANSVSGWAKGIEFDRFTSIPFILCAVKGSIAICFMLRSFKIA